MPIVQIHLLKGNDIEKKRLLTKRVTDVICETLGREPSRVRVILSEMEHENYSIGGVLHIDAENH